MFAWLGDEQATAQRRAELWRLLGPRSRREGGVKGHCLCRELHDSSAQVEHWLLDLHRAPAVPALLVLPPEGRVPRGAVLYGHAHGNSFDVGKDELLDGRPALQQPPYGPVLAARGWVALAIDHCGFGERRDPAERALAKRALWQGETLWGWRLQDTLAALDWLRMQPGLGALPVVALGLSMGGTMALWATALDPRIAGCAELCCSAEYDALLASGCFDLHGEYFFVPGLLTEFTLAEIAALIAPRPHLSLAGRADPLTPPDGLASLDRALREVYAALGKPQAWQQIVEPGGHAETPTMRERVLAWLDRISPDPALPPIGDAR